MVLAGSLHRKRRRRGAPQFSLVRVRLVLQPAVFFDKFQLARFYAADASHIKKKIEEKEKRRELMMMIDDDDDRLA